jgi:hypothetical protein
MKSLMIPILLLIPFLGSAIAQDEPLIQDTPPTAEEILARFVEAAGGQEAHDRIENRVTRGMLLAQGGSVIIGVRTYAEKPGRKYTVMEFPDGNRTKSCAGEGLVWEHRPDTGHSLAKGAKRGKVLRQAIFDRVVYWQAAWAKAEYTGTKTIGSEECFELTMTPKALDEEETTDKGRPAPDLLYFSRETGLFVMGTRISVGGKDAKVKEVHLTNYKKVDGILLPFTIISRRPGEEDQTVTQIESIQHNLLMMPRQFAPPPEIQAMIDREAKKADEKDD